MKRIIGILALCLLIGAGNAFAQPLVPGEWSHQHVARGIDYYAFSGLDCVSGAPQQVFVVDWNTNVPGYALRFTWSDKQVITSSVYHRENAVVALNAAYEPESVVVKVNGTYHSCMPKDTVMTTPVPNWKSEAAVHVDNSGHEIGISFAGKGLSIAQQRAFYAASSWDNILTSAPMLIDNYSPVGAFFADSTLTPDYLTSLNYEDPIRHQGVRHPRTAVALTRDGHFLLIAVDGRRKGISEGMSARELTRFLQRHFHPQYALNMDGGGSTTLCVEGQGDPESHVVNYPTGNKKYDHAGERKLFSHFCIVREPQGRFLPGEAPMVAADTVFRRAGVREEVLSNRILASGLDCVLDWGPKAATPAPGGYEPVYVSHYGRHGSRYAYTEKAYTVLLGMLRDGAAEGNLTPYGSSLLERLEAFWEKAQYQVGDLTELGWQQHQEIARTMVSSFPRAFKAGSRVDACSSPSVRSIISMSSFLTSLAKAAPKADIYAHQGMLDVQATRPNTGKNPFRYQGPKSVFPYPESSEAFFLRRFPQYRDVLARLFQDPDKGIGKRKPFDVFFNLYMFVAGMNSLPEDVRIDVDGFFTPEEYATLWEVDNYERFFEYLPYRTPCASIVDDIMAKADARLAEGSRGADLRFGHDHVVMSLLMVMDIDGFGYYPDDPDDLVYWFQTFRSAMATNIQFVFYRPKCSRSQKETLVKVLLNGEEARLGTLPPVSGPYYAWSDVESYLQQRISLFVNAR